MFLKTNKLLKGLFIHYLIEKCKTANGEILNYILNVSVFEHSNIISFF